MPRLSKRNSRSALAFDGSTNYVTVANPATLPTDAYTVNFWYRAKIGNQPLGLSISNPTFASAQGWMGRAGSFYLSRQGTNDVQVYAYLNAPNDFAGLRRLRFRNFYMPNPDLQWHMRSYVIYVDQGSAKCDEYEDGIKLGATHTVDYTGDTATPSGALTIGKDVSGNPFLGEMRDIMFVNYKMSQWELYMRFKYNILPAANTILDRFLFDESQGTTSTNVGTNVGNNGTLVNSPVWSAWIKNKPSKSVINYYNSTSNGASTSPSSTASATFANAGSIIGRVKVIKYSGAKIFGVYDNAGVNDVWRLNIETGTGYPFIWTDNSSFAGAPNPKVSDHGAIPIGWNTFCVTQVYTSPSVTGQIWVNGQLWGQQTQTRDVNAVAGKFTMNDAAVSDYVNGETLMYERVLSRTEIENYTYYGIIPANPKVWYKNNEATGNTRTDSSGNGFNGTGGTLTWYPDSPAFPRKITRNDKASLAFARGGTTGKVQISSNKILSGLTNYSVTALVKINMGSGGTCAIYCERAASGNDILKLETVNNTAGILQFTYRDDAGTLNQPNTNLPVYKPLKDGSWHYVGITKAGTAVAFYIDGEFISTATLTATNNFTDASIISGIGFDTTSGVATFDGNIKEVRLHNVTLTQAEMQATQLFSQRITRGLIDEYLLNEGAGTVSYDTAGTNNGTISGGTSWSAEVPYAARNFSLQRNLIPNGDFNKVPPFTAVTTGSDIVVDGTATGASSGGYGNPPSEIKKVFAWKTNIFVVTSPTMSYDTSVRYLTNASSFKLTGLAIKERVNMTFSNRIFPDSADTTDIKFNLIPVLPSTSYTATLVFKLNVANANGTAGVYGLEGGMFEHSATGYLGLSNIINLTNTSNNKFSVNYNEWTTKTLVFTTSANTRYINPYTGIFGDASNYADLTAWIGSISLVRTRDYYLSYKKLLDLNMVYNGGFNFYNAATTAVFTTASGVWIDGSTAGSSTQFEYGFGMVNSATSVRAIFDPLIKYSGNAALKISLTAAGQYAEIYPFPIESAVNVKTWASMAQQNTVYNYSFRMKTNLISGTSADGAFVAIREYNGDGTAVATTVSTKVLTTTDWTYYSGTFTTNNATRFIAPRLSVYGHTGAATLVMDVWFDSINIKPAPLTV